MKRAVIYRRISQITATNLTGSMEDQLLACQRRAAELGWALISVFDYSEEGKSAFNERPEKRPVFQRLLADAKARQFDAVLIYKYDRFSRKMLHGLQARSALLDAGVEVVSVTEPFDETTAAGRYAIRNMLNMAELFSDMLAERISTRRHGEAESGRHLGPAPVGYTHAGSGTLTRQSPFDQMVVTALHIYATGQHSAVSVATTLNSMGYTTPNGRSLIAEDIRRITENAPIYAGQVKSNNVWIAGKHEPLIDSDLCSRVLATHDQRSKTQRKYARTTEPTALLAGLVWCEACRLQDRDSKLHYHIDRRKARIWRAYRCQARTDAHACDLPYVPAEPIEDQILALCDTLALPDEWIAEALALHEAQTPQAAPPINRARIEERIRRLGRLYSDGLKSEAEYTDELAALRAQLIEVPAVTPTRVSIADIARYLRDLPTLIRAGNVSERRAVLSEVFDQFYVERGRVAAIRPTFIYELLVEAAHGRVTAPEYLSGSRNSVALPILLPARLAVQ